MEKIAANKTRRRGRRAGREDRISKLPEEILLHILCFLDQRTAATTSVLSKPWRYLWCTRPKIDFQHGITVVPGIKKESLLSVIDRTLRGYSDRKLHLQEVTLRLPRFTDSDAAWIKNWIRILVQSMGVNKFHLHFLPKYYVSEIQIPLPLSIFRSESLRNLSLYRCVLKSISAEPPLHLKHLQKLALHNVDIPEEILDGILSNCRFIECVSLEGCTGFKSIRPKHPASLREFRFKDNSYYMKVDVSIAMGNKDIPTLRRMELIDCLLSLNHNHQFYFSHLTHLRMSNVMMSSTDGLFSCHLPCLEELRLYDCSGIKEFNLSSPSMKRMEIYNRNSPFKVTVDAPSIVSFRYKGVLPQSTSFSAAAASSWKSYIDLTSILNESLLCLNDLIGLLKALSQSQISIELGETTVGWLGNQVDNNTNVGVDLPVVVDHLIVHESMRTGDFFNSLFLVLHPRFIYMNYIKALAKNPGVTERNLKQRDMMWQLFPEGVSTQVLYWNKGKGKWRPFEAGILSKLVSKKDESMDQICSPIDLERRIKLVIFDLDQASICSRKFILNNYLALCC